MSISIGAKKPEVSGLIF